MIRINPLAARAAVAALCLVAASCSSAPLVPYRTEPFLYLVLGQETAIGEQRAFLLTVGSPAYSEYLPATRFEMRRVQDGAAFPWRDMGQRGVAPAEPTIASLHDGNYTLPEEGSGSSSGNGDIRPGDTFDLIVEAEGVVMTGRVTMPAEFAVAVLSEPRRAVWPRVNGAALYSVQLRGYGVAALQSDTVVLLPEDVPTGTEVRVKALDENLARYVSDESAGRAGLDSGFGVFGAITTASVMVP